MMDLLGLWLVASKREALVASRLDPDWKRFDQRGPDGVLGMVDDIVVGAVVGAVVVGCVDRVSAFAEVLVGMAAVVVADGLLGNDLVQVYCVGIGAGMMGADVSVDKSLAVGIVGDRVNIDRVGYRYDLDDNFDHSESFPI